MDNGYPIATACNELCSSCYHQHTQVWPRSDARSTWYPALVGCTRACHIQVMLVCLQVSAWNGTAVCVCRRCVSRSRLWLAVVTCVQLSVVILLQTNDCWQKGIFFRWPVSMEQSSRVPQTKRLPWTRLSVILNAFCSIRTDSASSTLEISRNDSALYKCSLIIIIIIASFRLPGRWFVAISYDRSHSRRHKTSVVNSIVSFYLRIFNNLR